MLNSTFSQSVDDPTLEQPLDGRFYIQEVLTTQFCRQIYLAKDLHRPEEPECLVYHLQGVPDSAQYHEAIRALLLREVDVLAELGNHPQFPALLACFENESGFYVVQEKIPGSPVSASLQNGHCWSAEQVVQFLQATLDLLAFVQSQGCVHGNLTPSAILQQNNGRLALIDFGNLLHIQESLIAASGEPVPYSEAAQQGYQPLEQLQGMPCPASDVYAVGMIGIQALTGLRPTQLKVDLDARKILWDSQYLAESPLEQKLVEILDCMIAWDLDQRYGSAADILEAIAPLAESLTGAVPVLTVPANIVKETPVLAPDLPYSYTVEPGYSAFTYPDRPDYALSTDPVDSYPMPRFPNASPRPDDQFSAGDSQPPQLPPEPSPDPTADWPAVPARRTLFSNVPQPAVLIGAGGTVATLGLAAAGWWMLTSIGGADKVASIWERFSNRDRDTSPDQAVSDISQNWRQNWQTAADTYQQAETAFNLGQWLEVSQISQRMPPIPYWQDRGQALSKLAIARAETDANQLLQSAYTYATDRNFTAALRQLKQIPQETSVAEVAQTKIKEYSEKQVIRAWFDLQRAYDRAAVQDFTQALTYLWQIPVGTPPHEIAQEKIVEYTQKQQEYIRSLTQAASEQAQQGNFQVALLTLDKVPKGTALDPEVMAIAAQYTQQLNQQADQQLQQANQVAETGDKTAAVAALETVPMGTVAYAEARDKITEYTGKPPNSIDLATPVAPAAPQQAVALGNIDPGNQLREAL